MADILAVGVATIDIINSVECYPPEDAEVRVLEQRVSMGGNACNTLLQLSRLGHRCSWAGSMADDRDSRWLLEQFRRHRVETRYRAGHPQTRSPTSYITLSRRSGSRTIVHYRRLPEFSWGDFSRLELEPFDWVHFEGRNVHDLGRMMKAVNAEPGTRCSLEVEKVRAGIEALFPLADLLLFSRAYARHRGYTGAAAFLAAVRAMVPFQSTLVCAWGDEGAWGMDGQGRLVHAAAHPPPEIVDTLGAGDVFNAGVIHGLTMGETLSVVLSRACRLAGEKCGRQGVVETPASWPH